MKTKIGNVVLNFEFYSEMDNYSDGDDIENQLLDLVKENIEVDLEQKLRIKYSWANFYHLSEMRHNILEWLPFEKTDTVLEIGSGCGAITGVLAEKTGWVDCIELSKRRSEINAYRNTKYNNIEIFVGDFNVVETDKKYDYITLIGVLEYAELYSSSENPFKYIIEKCKKFLKEDGKLVIAIENRFGLKYFSGAREDHTGDIFDGIEGYFKTRKVKTFSKPYLNNLLKEAGLNFNHYYYPYPDYRFPFEIYSDDYLPSKYDLIMNNYSFDRDRINLFNETRAFKSIVESNLFDIFSNSFLVVSTKKEGFQGPSFVKYNQRRMDSYKTKTTIYAKDNFYVSKRLQNTSDSTHLKRMAEYYEGYKQAQNDNCVLTKADFCGDEVRFELVEGKSLLHFFLDVLLISGYDVFIAELLHIFDEIVVKNANRKFVITEAFKDFFDLDTNINLGELNSSFTTNIDLVPQNIKIKGNKYFIFDYEWTMDFELPREYILFRWIYLINNNYNCYVQKSTEQLCNDVGIGEFYDTFIAMEKKFSEHVVDEKNLLNYVIYEELMPNNHISLKGRDLSRISTHDTLIHEKNLDLIEMQKKLDEKDTLIHEKNLDLIGMQKKLDDKDTEIHNRNLEIIRLNNTLVRKLLKVLKK